MANEVLDDATIAGVAALESDPKLGPVAKCLAFLANGMDKLTKAKDKADDDEKDVKGKDTKSTDDYSGIDEDDDAGDDDDDETSEDGMIGKSYNSDVATEVSTLFDAACDRLNRDVTTKVSKAVGIMLAKQRDDIGKLVDAKVAPLQKALDTAVAQNEELQKAIGATKGNLEKALGMAGRQPVSTTAYVIKDGESTGTLTKADAEGCVMKAVTTGMCDQNQGSQILQKLAKVETGQHVEFSPFEQRILSLTK